MFAKHLPPSAGLPRVLVLDPAAAAELAGRAEVSRLDRPSGDPPPGSFDAVVGGAPPDAVARLAQHLRPGGRLILAARAQPEDLLAALTQTGLIHCLVEPQSADPGPLTLYRGERPPLGAPLERHAALAAAAPAALALIPPASLTQRFIFVLITQTPNKPAWKLSPDDRIDWRAATVLHPEANAPALLAFSGLVKAVAFMQSAVLAGTIRDVNKVGKFPAEAAQAWGLPVLFNPDFESVRGLQAGPPLPVDPGAAITGEE